MVNDLAAPLAKWFSTTHGTPTHAQELAVPAVLAGESVLLSSPTGSGKTLAGFLAVLDDLVRRHLDGTLGAGIQAVYVSPLRALSYDVEKNLVRPLRELGLEEEIRIGLRNGDTTSSERAKQKRRPPHILLTTPESLAILLPQKGWRTAFEKTRFFLVDELHALAENKRGAHLMVSAERLERISQAGPLVRVGLSATVAPLEEAARFLVGPDRPCRICEGRLERDRFLEVLTPLRRNPYPPSGFTAGRVLRDIAALVDSKRTVLVFCNTRSGAESLCHSLKNALPQLAHTIEAHHGSLDRDHRIETEDRLKNGELRAVVCSTSLELGIDVGFIDTVVMISTPKGVSRALQRVGRSGHSVHEPSHGVLVATNVNDLIECIVCAKMARENLLDDIRIFEGADDVAAQHLVGMAMEGEDLTREEALALFRRTRPFQSMDRQRLDELVDYLIGGGKSLQGQYTETFGKLIEEDGILTIPNQKVQRDYLVNVGTIHAHGMVAVYLGRKRLGEVDEAFLKRIEPGDRFVLAGRVVELLSSGVAEAHVKEAKSRLPTVPTWNANKMPLASGLADAVAAMRGELATRLESPEEDDASIADWLVEEWNISSINAAAVIKHGRHQLAISEIPVPGKMLVELYRPPVPESASRGDQFREEEDPSLRHYFFHSLLGRSANDALSRILVRRVNQAVGGNAMVTIDDYGFLLTLSDFQELGVEEWRELFKPENAMEDLDHALAGSELVKWLFRGVAQTGLMVPRNLPGKQRHLKQLRWSSEILFRVLDEREPNHPMLRQARVEAKHVFLDADRAIDFLEKAAALPWTLREVPAVSPFAFGIYASKIKEGMMMETPEEAIERLFNQFEKRVGEGS